MSKNQQLTQLLREAIALFEGDDSLDIRDWLKAARAALKG